MGNSEEEEEEEEDKKRLTALQQVREVLSAAQVAPLVSCPGRTLSFGPPRISYR